jgi:hypothetical protein
VTEEVSLRDCHHRGVTINHPDQQVDREPKLQRLAGEGQSEALQESGDALGVHREAVSLRECSQDLWLDLGGAAEIYELGEVRFESRRRDDLEESRGLIASVPEGMPLLRGLKIRSPGPPNTTSSPSRAPTRPSMM